MAKKPEQGDGLETTIYKAAKGNGRMSVKLVAALLFCAVGGSGVLSVFGLKQIAPDPEAVKETQADVKQMRLAQEETNSELRAFRVEFVAAMKAVAQDQGRDKAEWERRFQDQQREIDRVRELAERARDVADLKRRLEILEGKVK